MSDEQAQQGTNKPAEQEKTTAVVPYENKSEAVEKWGTLGGYVYDYGLNLKKGADEISNEASLQVTRENIKEADDQLAALKKRVNGMVDYRKKITTRLDSVISRLRAPEKEAKEAVEGMESRITSIKKEIEKEQEAKKSVEEERRLLTRSVESMAADQIAENKTKAYNMAKQAFDRALKDDWKPDQIDEYLAKVDKRIEAIADKEFHQQPLLEREQFPNLSKEELDEAQHELGLKIAREEPLTHFRNKIEEFFSDYESAYHNKEEAQKKAEEETEKAAEQEKEQAEDKKAAAEMASNSTPQGEVQSEHKPLKRSFEVDMEETEQNAFLILTAFKANRDRMSVNVKRWMNFTPQQAAKALAKAKSKDNNFQPEGIQFREVEKN